MTTLKVNAIEPEGATTNLVIGESGQNVVVGGSGGIKVNTMKDAGGNTLFTSNGSGVLSSVSGFGGAQVLISSQTASNSASLSFTSGIDSTYKEYVFEFYNIAPATDFAVFQFQVNASDDVGGDFDESYITSTFFHAHQKENGGDAALQYNTASDQAQGTSYQNLVHDQGTGNGADESCAGELHLFNPASTTYVKHFYARTHNYMPRATPYDWAQVGYVAGYLNQTLALSEISFKMNSGNFDGKIKMYGVK